MAAGYSVSEALPLVITGHFRKFLGEHSRSEIAGKSFFDNFSVNFVPSPIAPGSCPSYLISRLSGYLISNPSDNKDAGQINVSDRLQEINGESPLET